MTQVTTPTPRAATQLTLVKRTPKVTELHLVRNGILFYDGHPIAVYQGATVSYRSDIANAPIKAVDAWYPDEAHIRVGASDFDFIVGQVLTQTGMPLTRRPKDADES